MARETPPQQPRFAVPARGNFDLIVALFVAFLLISNVSAVKLVSFGPNVEVFGFPVLPIIADGGAFLFPLTYIVGDVLAEVYGMRGARRAILIGFAMSVLASAIFLVVGAAPAAADWVHQEAFDAILGFVPRIVVASLLGYLAGQFLNAFVLVKLKQRTPHGSLWTRLLGSTVVGEAADTVIFCVVAFAGIVTGGTLVNYIVVGYVYKVLVEVLLLPVTYRVIRAVKRREPSYAPSTPAAQSIIEPKPGHGGGGGGDPVCIVGVDHSGDDRQPSAGPDDDDIDTVQQSRR